MNVENSEAILLIPGGYLVWIDVDEASVGGSGTAMRFDLPLRAHNLPLMHSHETKLVVALKGGARYPYRSKTDCIAARGRCHTT